MATSRICSIPDCGKPARKRGWCDAHYTRWLRHGDPEAHVITPGEAIAFLEKTVLTYEGDECLIWPYAKAANGYGRIRIDGRAWVVSHVVCQMAHGDRPTRKHQAAHSCGRGRDGCVTKRHLSWKTRKENEADKLLHGTRHRGDSNSLSKISEKNVAEILSLRGRFSQQKIANMFGVSQQLVSMIMRGKRRALTGLQPGVERRS